MKNNKVMIFVLSLFSLMLLVLSACSEQKATDNITVTIQYEGSETSKIELKYSQDQTIELEAVVEGEAADNEITWSSNDAGVARVQETEGNKCTFSILKVGSVKITAQCGNATNTISIKIIKDEDNLSEKDVAITVFGENISAEKLNVVFVTLYNSFVNNYGDYASNYGLDISTGIADLANQSCDYSEDGTWKGYFAEEAVRNVKEMYALCAYAEENGITLDEEELQQIRDEINEFISDSEEDGYDSPDSYAVACFGPDATLECYEWYLNKTLLASKVYSDYYESIEYPSDELRQHYLDMGNEDDGSDDYLLTNMRHILILAEDSDGDGEYSDEEKAVAHSKIEEIYQEWQDMGATEDAFAELANKYSDDGGSNSNGGLYENIYKGQMVDDIDAFLFGERKEGDTTIIDVAGNYTGTHIVYFTGHGRNYMEYIAWTDLADADLELWMDEVLDGVEVEEGQAYDQIGKFE